MNECRDAFEKWFDAEFGDDIPSSDRGKVWIGWQARQKEIDQLVAAIESAIPFMESGLEAAKLLAIVSKYQEARDDS